MAALFRRLGIFTKSFHSTTRPRFNLTLKSFSTDVSTHDSELQTLVDKFKKSCEIQKFRHNKVLYARHVRRLAKAKQFDLIEDVLEHQKKFPDIQNEGFALRLISLYGESGMFEHARKLFDQLPALGCQRTVKSFNALLKSAIAAKEFQKVLELFKDLPSAVSVEPNVISHNTVVHALCEMGSLDEALSKLREMDKDANLVTYNTLISALYKNNRTSEAESLWAGMEEKGIEPNARSYDIRLQALFSEKKVDEAAVLAAEMLNKGIEADAFIYNTLIRGFCASEYFEEAKKCFDVLQKKKLVPHLVSTYASMIRVYCDDGDFHRAYEICSDAILRNLSLHYELRKQVIDGLNENGSTQKATELEKL